jgi:hypothetical protein
MWLGVRSWPLHTPVDFEECSEHAESTASSKEDASTLIVQCGAQFAGRRKIGGGYTYYDFMQNRRFDIAGPNPSPEEQKEIDRQYMVYLDTQRQAAIAAALAEKQREQLQDDLETARQTNVGPPMLITPTNVPSGGPKESTSHRSRAQRCESGSLSCSWSKLSASIKNAFGFSSGTRR